MKIQFRIPDNSMLRSPGFQDDMDSLLSDGFNKSDLSKDPPKPPDEKLMLKDKAYYLAWRLQDLNMEISKTYLDLEDGKN